MWQKITNGQRQFRVIFDMKKDLTGIEDYNISRNMSRRVKFFGGKWLTAEDDGLFHLYNAFNNGATGDVKKRKMSILGLVLSFNQNTGGLELLPEDYKVSKEFYPELRRFLTGRTLAKIFMEPDSDATKQASKRASQQSQTMVKQPCNVKWSNSLRFDPTDSNGKCLHFTAATEGSLFVIFSTLPKDNSTWYYTEITPERVAIYKVTRNNNRSLAREQQTHFRSSLPSLPSLRRGRSDDRKCVCCSQATVVLNSKFCSGQAEVIVAIPLHTRIL